MAGTLSDIYTYNFNGIVIPWNKDYPNIDWDFQFLSQGVVQETIKFYYPNKWDGLVDGLNIRNNSEIVVAPTSASGGKIVFGSGDETTHEEHCYIEGLSNEHLKIYGGRGVSVKGDSGVTIETEDSGSTIDLNSKAGVYIEGDTHCDGAYYTSSDARKKNIVDTIPLDKAYELVDKCQTIFYTWKNRNDNYKQREIGLLAQEVQGYFPELVQRDTNGYLSLDYSRLTVILLTVIRDLTKKVNTMDERLKVIEEKLK